MTCSADLGFDLKESDPRGYLARSVLEFELAEVFFDRQELVSATILTTAEQLSCRHLNDSAPRAGRDPTTEVQ